MKLLSLLSQRPRHQWMLLRPHPHLMLLLLLLAAVMLWASWTLLLLQQPLLLQQGQRAKQTWLWHLQQQQQ